MIIVIEGPDGVGKTSVCHELARIFTERSLTNTILRCPGSTKLGEFLRGPLKDPTFELSPVEKTLLFMAADESAHRLAEKMSSEGIMVIMDRCAVSNAIYRTAQGEHQEAQLIRNCFDDGFVSRTPNGAFLIPLDAPDAELQKRISGRSNEKPDRFDGLQLRVAQLYREEFPIRLDTTDMTAQAVAARVYKMAVGRGWGERS
jgi:dTMP kinase